jgi:hypothetical protein
VQVRGPSFLLYELVRLLYCGESFLVSASAESAVLLPSDKGAIS